MQFKSATEEIIKQIEELTDRKVSVMPDNSLKVIATMKMATDQQSHHLIIYNPNRGALDYTIAYQCGFILRLFENPPSNRFQFAGKDSKKGLIKNQLSAIKKFKKMGLPETALKELANQLFSGLMTQLRSIPIGMRIDQWIWDNYPELKEQQRFSLTKQQQDNAQALSPEIRSISPPLVFRANASMNSAFAQFCDRLFGQNFFAIPYRSIGFESAGENLLKISDQIPSDPTTDTELVNRWADELSLDEWYEWIPLN
ncbi:MAG TPA: hypothetical protein VF648_10720 [Pyrinomonadaceae bacterium]|jgi:hypothetical protein